MENLNQQKVVFVPPKDFRTKLSSKDNLYRDLTIGREQA